MGDFRVAMNAPEPYQLGAIDPEMHDDLAQCIDDRFIDFARRQVDEPKRKISQQSLEFDVLLPCCCHAAMGNI